MIDQPNLFGWEAKPCVVCGKCKPYSEYHKRSDSKDGMSRRCTSCERDRFSDYYKENGRKYKVAARLWSEKNADLMRLYKNNWAKRNRPIETEKVARYRASKKNATPGWSDSNDCRCFYESAKRVGDCLGIAHTVDHIIPLRGEMVSGLHVAANLQVLPLTVNSRKSNVYEV